MCPLLTLQKRTFSRPHEIKQRCSSEGSSQFAEDDADDRDDDEDDRLELNGVEVEEEEGTFGCGNGENMMRLMANSDTCLATSCTDDDGWTDDDEEEDDRSD
jgi:hypothetical protein